MNAPRDIRTVLYRFERAFGQPIRLMRPAASNVADYDAGRITQGYTSYIIRKAVVLPKRKILDVVAIAPKTFGTVLAKSSDIILIRGQYLTITPTLADHMEFDSKQWEIKEVVAAGRDYVLGVVSNDKPQIGIILSVSTELDFVDTEGDSVAAIVLAPLGPARVVAARVRNDLSGLVFSFSQPVTAAGLLAEPYDLNLAVNDPSSVDPDAWVPCSGAYQVNETTVYCVFRDIDPPGYSEVSRWRITGELIAITCETGITEDSKEFGAE